MNAIFPHPQYWQYIWLSSLVSAIIGVIMIRFNFPRLLSYFQYANLIFGFIPTFITIIFNINDLWEYAMTKNTNELFYGFPIIVIWYIVLIVLVQIHIYSFYFARVLAKNWKVVKKL